MTREAMDVCLRVLKESNKSRFDSYSVRHSVLIISHITFRHCRLHISSHNLSRNSCILQIKCLQEALLFEFVTLMVTMLLQQWLSFLSHLRLKNYITLVANFLLHQWLIFITLMVSITSVADIYYISIQCYYSGRLLHQWVIRAIAQDPRRRLGGCQNRNKTKQTKKQKQNKTKQKHSFQGQYLILFVQLA